MVLLFLVTISRTNIDPLKVLSTMETKQDRVYARGRSKYVAPSARMVIVSDDEHDPEYVPPVTSTPSRAARASRATPKKVASGVVTASLGVSWSEVASGSTEAPTPATAAASASSDDAFSDHELWR